MTMSLYSGAKRTDLVRTFKGADAPNGAVGDMWFDTVAGAYKQCISASPVTWAALGGSGGSGVSDHGALTGLADDDHTQYLNVTRGDARYPLTSDSRLSDARTPVAHTQASTTITDFSTAVDARITAANLQPLDGDLTAIAGLAGTSGFAKKTAANTWTLDTSTYLTGITSGNVTSALGFTPYNATNPSGYITGNQTITYSGDATGSGTTAVTLSIPSFAGSSKGLVPVSVGGTTNFLRADGTWAAPAGGGGGGSPGGSTTQVQYNLAGAFAGATNVKIDNNDLVLANSTPVTPAAGHVKLFGKSIAGRVLAATVGPSGMDAAIQPSIWRQKIASWNPPGNATTVPGVFGMTAPTAVGTATSRSVATTNLMSRTKRLGYVSAATAAALCGHYVTTAQWTTGNGSGLGGFFYSCRFAYSDAAAVTGARSFVGMSSTVAAPTNVEPSGLLNSIGVAQLSTDATQLFLVYGGSAAQSAIALGTNFPPMTAAGATNGVVYDLTLFAAPSTNGVVNYRLERVGTAFVAEGTLTPTVVGTQTPASTTLMAPRAWRTNNATLLAVGIDILNVYLETDY